MNKILSTIKQHLVVGILILAVAALGVSNFQLQNKITNSSNRILSFEEGNDESLPPAEESVDSGVGYPEDMEMPFASCYSDILYRGEASNTYNTNTPYDPSFFYSQNSGNRAQNGFLDVNGDNLVDYVYSDTHDASNSTFGSGVYNRFVGCVYLNNGHGWDKVFQCIATTATDNVTGDINVGEFRGDCAGEPSSQKQSE